MTAAEPFCTLVVGGSRPAIAALPMLSEREHASSDAMLRSGRNPDSTKSIADARGPYRILIADDHEAVRRGLRAAIIGAGWIVCGEAADGREAVEKTAQLKPDLVILDVSMPNLNGLEAAREILESGSTAKLIVFTMHESPQIREEANRIGVHGYAAKSDPLSNLLANIRSILGE